jgi:hypothetical protein
MRVFMEAMFNGRVKVSLTLAVGNGLPRAFSCTSVNNRCDFRLLACQHRVTPIDAKSASLSQYMSLGAVAESLS